MILTLTLYSLMLVLSSSVILATANPFTLAIHASTVAPIINTSVSFPIDSPNSDPRTLIPVQMMLPNGQWSKTVIFNFDTGASWPTDIPPQLLSDFGAEPVSSDERVAKDVKIRFVGFPLEFMIPTMVQDEAHYDLFKENPDRYPLLRVRDLMPYMSITYEKDRTILRSNDLGVPPELNTPGTIRFPDASMRSDAPTSSWYWTKVKISHPSSGRAATDWFLIDSGNKEVLVKKSLANKIGLDLSPGRNSRNFNSFANIEFSEAKPIGDIENMEINVREDSARFGRGGEPRNLIGGPRLMDDWSIVLWDLHIALVPSSR
jgi:predicted aspartyl protease